MTVTDFHSHILPNLDDGSPSVEVSLAMLRAEREQGITHVIATPHFYPLQDTLDSFLERRGRAMAQLREAMDPGADWPKLTLGAEVYFFRGMNQSEALERLTIADKKCILIEMPPAPWADETYRELTAIYTQRGIIPVIAHIDRYIRPFRTYGIPRRLAELPVLVQSNAEFFLKKATEDMALRMLKTDRIHLLGSDCHNMVSRKPNLGAAIQLVERKLGRDALERIRGYESIVLDASHKDASM